MDLLLPLLASDFMGKPAWIWLAFVGVVVALMTFDLGARHKGDDEIGVRENLLLKFLKRYIRVTVGGRDKAFWVRESDPATGVLVSPWKTREQPALGGAE